MSTWRAIALLSVAGVVTVLFMGCAASSGVTGRLDTHAELAQAALERTNSFLEQCGSACGFSLDPQSAVDSVHIDGTQEYIIVTFNESFGQIPFREENVALILGRLQDHLGPDFRSFALQIMVGDVPLAELIPNIYRTDSSRIDVGRKPAGRSMRRTPGRSHVVNVSRPHTSTAGLQGRHIAVWPSHGWYFESSEGRWKWQRPRLFQSVEDLLPMSFVVPYLVPMLERAGARVYLPRERDPQHNEAIVDNDDSPVPDVDASRLPEPARSGGYIESDNLAPGFVRWTAGENQGFSHGTGVVRGDENPFRQGTYRVVRTDSITTASAAWIPDIPEPGEYAVYISYAKLSDAVPDARYTVHHLGGETIFLVDQTMGAGTWTYLGTFRFARGVDSENGMVTLENESAYPGRAISGDGVRFGGGTGNIVRGNTTSGRPRFTEAARYYMQFSGMPDSLVFNVTGTLNDYVDDYRGRAEWVNYLRGAPSGPNADRSQSGLGIPLDVSLAFHTDAGITNSDTTIGTLMIYSRAGFETETHFPDGMSRLANRDLGDIMQTQIVRDLRLLYDSTWSRRPIWDRDYSEAVRPNIPGVLLELLSHQNFSDMKFALDPAFRFDVSRAIYKSLLRFISSQNGLPYVVQPLSVINMVIERADDDSFLLTWDPRPDTLEKTAEPAAYIVYRRQGTGGFDNGTLTNETSFPISGTMPGIVYSYRVSAVNDGGESALSEVVSMGISVSASARASLRHGGSARMLVINGFDRVAAPGTIDENAFRGFSGLVDEGVADGWDVSFVGNQYDFDFRSPYIDDDAPGHGASYATFETWPRVGNTFDYAAIHGHAILASGVSFVTASNEAVAAGELRLDRFDFADVILGEQRTTIQPGNRRGVQYQTFSDRLKSVLRTYAEGGGRLFVSGAYVGSDLNAKNANDADRSFSADILHMRFQTDHASETGRLFTPVGSFFPSGTELSFNVDPAADIYRVESPDAILPASSAGEVLFRYRESNSSAAVGRQGPGSTVVFGFPFETITGENVRAELMASIIDYLSR